MTVLRELWYCHVAVLSSTPAAPSNPPRFPCAYPFLSDFRGQFWRSSGTQNGSCGISSESSRRPLSNDIKFARIGVRTRELWLPEVGVSELFLCTLPMKIPVKRGMLFGEPRVPRRSRSHYLSNAPGLADQLVASRKDSAREGGSCAAYFCKVPDSRESELGLVRYGPASRVHRGVFGPFEGSFPIRIPADPDKFLAIREFHVVHGCVLFPMCPGSQINLLRVRKTLCASVATSALHRGELGFARYDPANGGRRNVPYAKGGGQFDPVFGLVNGPVKPWSNLVNLGQTWSNFGQSSPNSWRCIPDYISRVSGQVFDADEPSSDQAGLVRAASFCAPTPEKIPGPEPSRSDPTRALRIKYSQEEGPRHISQAYLGGNVCAKILSDPLQLGPRAKTLRQEVHFSYHTQLSDRQELLRSSRNLSQKLTPWHKEHSDGLRSQDHISRTQARLCARPVPLKSRRNKAVLKFPEFSHRRCRACAQSLPDSQQVDLRARAHWKEDTSMHDVELSDRQEFIGRKLSDGTKNVKIRHRELGQICARTGTRFEKKRAGSKTHFFSRTAAFARRVFPARNKLIREPGCVGKIMTPATSWNSRFADKHPPFDRNLRIGRVHENSSDTPTSGSHNSLVRTPIRANFISLERGRRELSDDMPHDPF
uniref:Uncharacterized protein n=1 Tax=Fagus sylvatica TaxID=28930 RepID=A0A2N9HWD4_FAGSY